MRRLSMGPAGLRTAILAAWLVLGTAVAANAAAEYGRKSHAEGAAPTTARKGSKKSAKRRWSKPRTLGRINCGCLFGVQSVMAGDGGSLTVWERGGVRARWRNARGRLGRTQSISPASQGTHIVDPRAAMARNGTAVIMWIVQEAGAQSGQYARVRYRNGRLGPVQQVSAQDSADGHDVFFRAGDSKPRVLWSEVEDPPAGFAGGFFLGTATGTTPAVGGGRQVAADRATDDPAVAVDGHGNALIVFNTFRVGIGSDAGRQVFVRVLRANGRLGPVVPISRPGHYSPVTPWVRASVSPGGRGHVVWPEAIGGGYASDAKYIRLQTRSLTTAGAVGPARTAVAKTVPGGATPRKVDIATFRNGRSLLVWTAGRTGPMRARIIGRGSLGKRLAISRRTKAEPFVNVPGVLAYGSRATVIWSFETRASAGGRGRPRPFVSSGVHARTVTTKGKRGKVQTVVPRFRGTLLPTSLAGNADGDAVVSGQAIYPGRPGRWAILSARK